jgi:hypothetical protein
MSDLGQPTTKPIPIAARVVAVLIVSAAALAVITAILLAALVILGMLWHAVRAAWGIA